MDENTPAPAEMDGAVEAALASAARAVERTRLLLERSRRLLAMSEEAVEADGTADVRRSTAER